MKSTRAVEINIQAVSPESMKGTCHPVVSWVFPSCEADMSRTVRVRDISSRAVDPRAGGRRRRAGGEPDDDVGRPAGPPAAATRQGPQVLGAGPAAGRARAPGADVRH